MQSPTADTKVHTKRGKGWTAVANILLYPLVLSQSYLASVLLKNK